MSDSLLGKKRETKDTHEEDELTSAQQTKEDKEKAQTNGDKKENKVSTTKTENDEKVETKKGGLFGDGPKKTGLLGDLNKAEEENKGGEGDKSKNGSNKLFSNTGSSNLFAGSSLFSSNPTTSLFGSNNQSSLFSSTGNTSSLFNFSGSNSSSNSLFGSKPLVNFSNLTKDANSFLTKKDKSDEEDDGEEGGDELFEGSNSPSGAYNPVEAKAKFEVNSIYTKKYVKQVDNIFVHNKEENKMVSKGSGYLSIEYADKDNKKTGVIVFRNAIGNKIVEGNIIPNIAKLEKLTKNFKHIASLTYIQQGKDSKPEVGRCRVPFAREEELKEFEEKFDEVIKLLK